MAWSTNTDIWTVPVDGGEPKNLTDENKGGRRPAGYSPDGKFLAYVSQARAGFESDLWVLTLRDRRDRRDRRAVPRPRPSGQSLRLGGQKVSEATVRDLVGDDRRLGAPSRSSESFPDIDGTRRFASVVAETREPVIGRREQRGAGRARRRSALVFVHGIAPTPRPNSTCSIEADDGESSTPADPAQRPDLLAELDLRQGRGLHLQGGRRRRGLRLDRSSRPGSTRRRNTRSSS